MSHFELSPDFVEACGEPLSFDEIMALDGEIFRQVKARRTFRFVRGGHAFFAKIHRGIGWPEIIKDLLQLRLPILGARNEWQAIRHLESIGVATMRLAASGERGLNPAAQESFVITHELSDCISLEDLAKQWTQNPPTPIFLRAIIEELARISRLMHCSGMNHRDYYLCHFLLPRAQLGSKRVSLHVIDLHRVQLRDRVPRRWQEKDLAGLYFSALDAGFTRRHLLRFVRRYEGRPVHQVDTAFWRTVERKALNLYRKDHHREPSQLFFVGTDR